MGFWIFMMIMNLLIPFTMIGFGRYFSKNSPKEINAVFGYRTSRSMKNKDTWIFAHNYFGKLWYAWGWILLPSSIVPMVFVIGKTESIIGILGGILVFIQMIFMIGCIFLTERALKKNFDENENK